jgi:small subunit ribosomal protein S1
MGRYFQRGWQKLWIEGGLSPMQAKRHGDLSTMPAANFTSGRVPTMFEGHEDPAGQNKNPDEMGDFNEMEALLRASANPISIKRGDVVEGVIVRIDQDEILVDIGLKSEGVLSTKELPASGYGSFNELHLNDKVLVYVIQPESAEGHAVLSLKRANTERQWRNAEEQHKSGELLNARVIDYNKGGLIVDVNGIRGFVPISQIMNLRREEVAAGGENQETAAKLQSMKDKVLQLKIIEINRARNRLILSERLAVQEWRQRRREELLDELKPGEVRRGVVSNLANFGAFVDLGGADGLVHISQLAWSRVNHPSEVLHIGQEVEVQVLSVDKDKKKIALSIKRAEVDPWTTVEQRYTPGQLVTGVVTKIAPFGAFARIEDGIEGLIHLSELTPGVDPKTVLHEGAQLQLRILRIDAERRRLGLSLRQVEEPEPPPAAAEAPVETSAAGTPKPAAESAPAAAPSLEALPSPEHAHTRRHEGRGERRERPAERAVENPLLSGLPSNNEGETTAMAEAFRAAARQRAKEEAESSE